MKEQQCLDCGLFNLLSRHTCEYCGSTNLKVIEHSTIQKISDRTVTEALTQLACFGEATIPIAPAVEMQKWEFVESGRPAFLQCGKITGEIKDGVTLCGKPMYHEGGCK